MKATANEVTITMDSTEAADLFAALERSKDFYQRHCIQDPDQRSECQEACIDETAFNDLWELRNQLEKFGFWIRKNSPIPQLTQIEMLARARAAQGIRRL
jgi:hypothetical protein